MQFADINDLKSAYTEADRHTWTKKDLEAYAYARMRETDEITEKMLVEERAKIKAKFEIAKSLLQTVLTNEDIAKHTGLTVEQIETLRNPKEE
jgi:predicted transposase/invertase (TIGR01784 family)